MKKGFIRPFILLSLILSDLACWSALFLRIAQPGGRAGAAEAAILAAALAIAACFVAVQQGIFQQIDELENMVQNWDSLPPDQLEARAAALGAPVRKVGALVYSRLGNLREKEEQQKREIEAETERTLKIQIARDICQSTLPGRLPDYPSRENFAAAGIVREGWRNACVFYDIFFIDPGLLCVAVGQVPGEEVSEALYMTVAQTTIRSRLRMGRSLAETLADVNTQMYDLGGSRSTAVLVATLDTSNGRLYYVNAGVCPPLLMRSGQDYEWLDTPQFAPLGLNQSVAYRTQELRLRQGDRLFLHTEGLGAEKNEEGTVFRSQELRPALIRTQGEGTTPEAGLNAVAERAAAFASQEARLGYAALLLEFKKGDKELSHCRVPASPDSGREVLDFLKTRFSENGIQRRHYAQVAVLTEELFSLCCRNTQPESLLTVECGVAPDGESVNVRVTGPFQGRNPLEAADAETPGGQSAAFIEEHAEFTSFKANTSENRDTVTMICFLT